MKKILLVLTLVLTLSSGVLLPSFAMAQDAPANPSTQKDDANSQLFQECNDPNNPNAANSDFCKNAQTDNNTFTPFGKTGLFTKIVQIIVWLVAVVSVLMIVIGGFRYVVSGGDSNATAGAKNTIIYALIGLVVAIFAQVIVSFVLSQIT